MIFAKKVSFEIFVGFVVWANWNKFPTKWHLQQDLMWYNITNILSVQLKNIHLLWIWVSFLLVYNKNKSVSEVSTSRALLVKECYMKFLKPQWQIWRVLQGINSQGVYFTRTIFPWDDKYYSCNNTYFLREVGYLFWVFWLTLVNIYCLKFDFLLYQRNTVCKYVL